MTLLFAATELESFRQTTPGGITTTTTEDSGGGDDYFDLDYSRSAFIVSDTAAFASVILNTGITTSFMNFALNTAGNIGQGTADILTIKNQAGTEVVWLKGPSSGANNNVDFQRWDGATRQTIANISQGQKTFVVWTIRIVIHASAGYIEAYQDGNLAASYGPADTTALGTSIKEWHFSTCGSSSPRFSEVIVADESTIGWRVFTAYPNGAGTLTSWTGAYTDIDEAGIDDADSVYSGTTSAESSWNILNPDAPATGFLIEGVTLGARCKWDGTGPSNIALGVYEAGSLDTTGGSYTIDTQQAMTLGYLPYHKVYEVSTTTATNWTFTQINSLQIGQKALA